MRRPAVSVLPLALVAALLASLPRPVCAQEVASADAIEQLRAYSLEQLTEVTVTSVSKRPEPLSQAAASVYVITGEDIRRAGATSLPEALRLAPNLEVARINAGQYAITARGLNSAESSNKLLVLVNGRSVYEPIGSGVLWQQVDVVMANIDHIEVISGPGGTLWGANAVNGVINVITKTAQDTQGVQLDAGAGDRERDLTLTYGGRLAGGAYRLSLSGFDRSDLERRPGDPSEYGFRGVYSNFRFDGGDARAGYTVVANLYNNRFDAGGGDFWGGHLMGRATRRLADGSQLDVQAYVARDDRSGPDLHEKRDTYNIQAQHALTLGRHELVWGGEGRIWREYFLSTNAFFFADPNATIGLGAIFAQDTVALPRDLKLTLGLKLEDNSYSGLDWMPNLRIAWAPDDDALLWGAISRAVRTPNRIERELQATGFLSPSPDFQSESLWSFELGYRATLAPQASVSLTVFYDRYDDLRTDEFTAGGLPIVLRNGAKGNAYGVEAWGNLAVAPWWRLRAGLNTLQKDIRLKPGHTDLSVLQIAGIDPRYQGQLRSEMQLSRQVQFDLGLRRVGRSIRTGVGVNAPAYTEADARLAWRIKDDLELSLNGRNLLHDSHLEIDDRSTAPLRLVPRSVYLALRREF